MIKLALVQDFASVFLAFDYSQSYSFQTNQTLFIKLLGPPPRIAISFFVMKNPTNQQRHVFIINSGEQEAHILQSAAYSIGRDKSNAIVIDFPSISRQHALLLRVPNPSNNGYKYRIVDGNAEGKKSVNGIFVNGERVNSHELKNGDYVSFGKNIKAGYLSLSMGEVELMEYLESISYQRLKIRVQDSKATIVGEEMPVFYEGESSSVDILEQSSPLHSKTPEWVTTLSDSEIPSLASSSDVSCSDSPNSGRSIKKNNIQRCMAVLGSILGISLIGLGFSALLDDTKTKPRTSSGTSSLVLSFTGG